MPSMRANISSRFLCFNLVQLIIVWILCFSVGDIDFQLACTTNVSTYRLNRQFKCQNKRLRNSSMQNACLLCNTNMILLLFA